MYTAHQIKLDISAVTHGDSMPTAIQCNSMPTVIQCPRRFYDHGDFMPIAIQCPWRFYDHGDSMPTMAPPIVGIKNGRVFCFSAREVMPDCCQQKIDPHM